jgi:hypothetical protein
MLEGKIDTASDRANAAADQSENAAKHNLSEIRLFYLSEDPFSSGIRSFMVYLLLLAGLYLATGGDPFKDPSASQYLRLAGLVSCVAFAIGYDPSRFTELLNYIPKLGGTKS